MEKQAGMDWPSEGRFAVLLLGVKRLKGKCVSRRGKPKVEREALL